MATSVNLSSKIGLISSTVLLVLYVSISLSTASPVSRPFKCPVCSDADRARCSVVVAGPECEVIEEPNCGCCKMCAKKIGEKCGVATGLCESGLECIPPPMTSEEYENYGPADYYTEVLMGNFICVTHQQFLDILTGVAYGDEIAEGVYIPELYDPGLSVGDESQTDNSQTNSQDEGNDKSHLNPFIPEIGPVIPQAPRPIEPPTSPFPNSEEPCIYHTDKVWGKLHFDHHEWVPSCEKNGLYYPEQCEVSYGLERGRCWCVDPMGVPLTKFTPGEQARPELCLSNINKT